MGEADLTGPELAAATTEQRDGRQAGVRAPERRPVDESPRGQGEAGGRVHAGHFEAIRVRQVGQQLGQLPSEPGEFGAAESDEQQVVATSSGDLNRAPDGRFPSGAGRANGWRIGGSGGRCVDGVGP